MKPTAYLINVARGPIIDEAALIEVLREGKIAGAGLDVFEHEPPDPANPLLTMENVIPTAHCLCWTDLFVGGRRPRRHVRDHRRVEWPIGRTSS